MVRVDRFVAIRVSGCCGVLAGVKKYRKLCLDGLELWGRKDAGGSQVFELVPDGS
jgi:hypothetical protein